MKKNIISIVAALFLAGLVTAIVEFVGHLIFPVAQIQTNDKAAIAEIMKNMPVGAFMMIALAWGLGTFVGAVVVGMQSESKPQRKVMIFAGIEILVAIVNMLAIPHPLWFWLLGLSTCVLSAILGGRLGFSLRDPSEAEQIQK